MEVFIIITPGIEQGISNLDPTKISYKFKDGKEGNVDTWGVASKWTTFTEGNPKMWKK
jgi:hypothetical protein